MFESHSLGVFPKRETRAGQPSPITTFLPPHNSPSILFYLFIFTWGLATSSEASGQLPNWRWISLVPAHDPGANHCRLPGGGVAVLTHLVQQDLGDANQRIIFWNASESWKAVCVSDDASTDQVSRSAVATNAERHLRFCRAEHAVYFSFKVDGQRATEGTLIKAGTTCIIAYAVSLTLSVAVDAQIFKRENRWAPFWKAPCWRASTSLPTRDQTSDVDMLYCDCAEG